MMNTFDISPRTISHIADKYPENLIFFPEEILSNCLERTGFRVRAAVIAEFFVRYYMSGNSCFTDIINHYLLNGETLEFSGLLSFTHRESSFKDSLNRELWNPSNEFSRQCRNAVRQRFQVLLRTDGLIPIFMTNDTTRAFLLPFSFESKKADDNSSRVLDIANKVIPEWTGYLKELGIDRDIRIHCHCLDDQPFEGDSMMLPVLMAWWSRPDGDNRLLSYNPFSIVATGAFDKNGLLKTVTLNSKPKAVETQLWRAAFIYPQNSEILPETMECKRLSPAISQIAVREEIRNFIEQRTNWDKDYAIRRLKELSLQVRKWNASHWKELIEILEKASEAFNEYEDPENYLLNLMFQSEANCHCGNTERAKEINEDALLFAEEHDRNTGDNSFLYFILRLEIEQLVLHQDDEEFEMIATPSVQLEQKMKEFESINKDKSLANDLWMRYCGTMGQIHLCASLMGLAGFSSHKAKHYFQQAIKYAIAIGDDADMAQDFNYMVLYHAVYEPGSRQEQHAVKAARSKIAELRTKNNKAYKKSLFFFLRYVAFSLYRQVLLGAIPNIPDTFELELLCRKDKEGAEGWLQATVGKYIGAVYAANSDLKSAEEWFESNLCY